MNNHEHHQPGDHAGEQHERDPSVHPQIWIASLADYVDGRLHGAWIDATQEIEDLEQAVMDILARSPTPGAEEWAIHDYDGFGTLRLGEYETLEDVSAIAQGIARHGPAFAAWAEVVRDGGDPLDHDLLAAFEDHYIGQHESREAWAEEMCDDLGFSLEVTSSLPTHIQPYVTMDYEGMARDMEVGGEITATECPGGGVWVFWSL